MPNDPMIIRTQEAAFCALADAMFAERSVVLFTRSGPQVSGSIDLVARPLGGTPGAVVVVSDDRPVRIPLPDIRSLALL